MSSTKIAAIALIAAGVLGLAYGGFNYTRTTHEAEIGPLELSVKDTRTFNIPVWAGIAAIVLGGGILVFGVRKA
jgi:TRAP-type C4-dicarboxylate transport system permease small subunit